MPQKKNSVVLSATAMTKLQKLVDTGEYCTLDDAASHIITTVLNNTYQYSTKPELKTAILPDIPSIAPDSKPNLAEAFRAI